MKDIRLERIEIKNFKGIKEMAIDFHTDITSICGRNASGKTSVFDAFTWCLFGKDSSGRSDSANGGFMVKAVDGNGDFIPHLEHSVTVHLTINGERKVFTRVMTEDWSTKRGTSEQVFKGNVTHYFIDGVEVNAAKGDGSYESEVNAVCSESTFRQITNPAHFPTLPWKEQRELLLTIAGDVTLKDMAAGNAQWEAIVAEIEGHNLDDYRRQIANERKDIEAEMKLIPARISGMQMATPQADEWGQIELALAHDNARMALIEKELLDISERQNREFAKASDITQEIYTLKARQAEVLDAAITAARDRYREANAGREDAEKRIEALRRESIANTNRHSESKERVGKRIAHHKEQIARLNAEREDLLKKWEARNAEQYEEPAAADHFNCPLCDGMECRNETLLQHYAESCAADRQAWHKCQCSDLDAITAKGRMLNEQIAMEGREQAAAEEELTNINKGYKEEADRIDAALRELHTYLQQTPATQAADVKEGDMPEWVELEKAIEERQEAMKAMQGTATDTSALTEEKATLKANIDSLIARLANRDIIAKNDAMIEQEKDRLQTLADHKAALECKEMAIEELVRKQSDEIERRVNSLFEVVRFRMFEPQVNGGEKPTCVATVKGVRYGDLNSAMKTNAGLDIINTICRYNEVLAPIFIDNAEGVNTLLTTRSQIVRLVVTDGDLTVE